ncbi:MAG: hypothetical protein WBE13_03660 [Candidatus Acidiferrum sp.]
MKLDAYTEIYLWNKNVDALIRVLQRMEALGILTRQAMKAHELRLEEIRSALNADFSEAMFVRERGDHLRLNEQRTAWEQNRSEAPQ